MSKFGDLVKKGWHPEKEGKKEGTGLRNQVKGLVGRGDAKDDRNKDHVSRPLHTLTDPSSLPPPPQRRGTGLAAPTPAVSSSGGEKRKVVTAPSKYQDPHGPRVEPPARVTRVPAQEQEQEEAEPAPPRPYRTDTTGLRTDHLPPPPGRRDGADGRSPPSYTAATTTRAVPALPGRAGAAPSLPPRLPPRGAATPPSTSPQSTGSAGNGGGVLNQGAVSRLGAAGVSVPGLGIGKSNTGGSGSDTNHLNELQNRFARFNTSTTTEPAAAPAASQGTTWAQKQAALKTASQLHKDPSQVSLADARAAAGTANNFRQRHGDQVAAGYGKAQAWNQKYGVADKVGGFAQKVQGGGGGGANGGQESDTGAAKKKPPPPPPPKKKPGLAGSPTAEDDAPPPIPLSTRPNF
ncbi:GMP synthase [Cordyceps militaris]|uniref:GMP synthase n=1 Tax=Cordyceps militaris TaxID=73501 RepID=A0A2H4SM45_CORMI|nr:GMP synthase [Cordyceps militaris]